MSKPSKAVLRLPIEKRAEIAFKIAVAKAIDEHARLGLPVYIWRDGRVVELSPAEVRNISEPKRDFGSLADSLKGE
jgi:hypothetical protein